MIPLWFLPYAIACGNTFILKPSERDPRAGGADRRADRRDRGDPAPASSTSSTAAARRSTAILDHPGDRRDLLRRPGRDRAASSPSGAAATGKRVQALGGAKNSMVVMPDADLEQAVPAIMGSAFGAAGQRCLAGSVCVIVGDEERQRRGARGAGRARPASSAVGAGRRPGDRRLPDGLGRRPASGSPTAIEPGRGRGRRARARRPRRRRAGRRPARARRSSRPPTPSPSWRARSSSGRC